MSFNDCKISEWQIQTTGVQSQPDTLTGSAADNKMVFDALPTLVIQKLNSLIDQLQQQAAAGQIGVTPFDGMTAQTLQDALEQIHADIGGNYGGVDGAGKVGYTPSEGVDEDTVQAAIEAVQANLTAYIAKIKAATGAAEVGNAPIAGMTATNVQQALEELRKDIDNIVSGIIPGGSITSDMLQDGAVTADKLGSDVTAKLGVLGGATTPQGALANLGAGVRPNIGDNCCFIGGGTAGKLPVNQRGVASGQISVDQYFIDRWMLQAFEQSISYELDADGLTITTTHANQGLRQPFEAEKLEVGKTYTSSVLLADGILMTKTFVLSAGGNEMMHYDGSQWTCALIKRVDGGWFWYPLVQYIGALTIKPAYVKLEEGSTQTLAYQDDTGAWQLLPQPESDYATQLARCQRYLVPMENAEMRASRITTSAVRAWFPTPVPLRANPVLSSGSFQVKTLASGNVMPGAVWSYQVNGCGVLVTAILEGHGQTDCTIFSNGAVLAAPL